MMLVLFGGAGFGNAREIIASLRQVKAALQIVFITGRNRRLESELRRLTAPAPDARGDKPAMRVLGWANNMHEWMAAADLLLSKPGGGTLMEAASCGLPMLAFDPLPGNEERTCHWLEKWRAGLWLKRSTDIAPAIDDLLANPAELSALRERARSLARPRAAHAAAEAILQGWSSRQRL